MKAARSPIARLVGASAWALAAMLASAGNARANAVVEGRWLTEKKLGVVEIFRCDAAVLCGRLAWVRIPPSERNPQALDIHNPDPALRGRRLCGLTIMWGFRPDGPNQWEDGSLYDPESGTTYRGEMTLRPDGTLSLRGYVLVSLFGRSEEWTRFNQKISRCPAE